VGRSASVTGGFCVERSRSDKLTSLTCLAPTCGNGVVEPGEECDPPDVQEQCAAVTVCDATCRSEALPSGGDRFGAAVASCDFDGDGFADLAVGVPLEDVGAAVDAGAVNVLYGGPAGLSDAGNKFLNEDLLGGAAEEGDRFGSALGAGDFNGDGFCDLAVGIPGKDAGAEAEAGATRVLYGGPAGLNAGNTQLWTQNDPGIADAAEAGDRFGGALTAGDFDHDGFDDLAIGVPGEDVGAAIDGGAVHVLYGTAQRLTDVNSQFWTRDDADIADAAETGDRFGSALTAGDFDGDGFADLAIGIPGADVGGVAEAGAVTILYGRATRLSAVGSQTFDQATPDVEDCAETGDHFGSALASGDFNGDGFGDLAIGVPDEDAAVAVDAGAVNVLYGTPGKLTATGSQLWDQDSPNVGDGADAGDHFGSALASGDFDGDGFADLAIGVPDEDVGAIVDAGAVNVLYGRNTGLSDVGNQVWHQDQAAVEDVAEDGDHFGCALATGDFNGNGFADLAIGVPGEDVGAVVDAGAVNVLYGTALRLSAVNDQFWSQASANIEDDAE
jgi:FG-GAP repeat